MHQSGEDISLIRVKSRWTAEVTMILAEASERFSRTLYDE